MTAQDALQRRLAAVTATTSGSNNTTTPYIPTMHDVAARRGSSSSTGTQERVVYWTDITKAEDEDMEQESVDGEGAHEDLDVDEQGSQKRRQQDKCQRTGRRPRRPRHRRSLLGPDTYGPTCSSPPSLSSSLAGSSSSLNTPSDSCGSTTSCSHPHEETNYRRPSPVELPEILHLIFQALVNMTPLEEFSQRDLLQCLMVCKQWYIVGQKTLWRDIRLRDPEQLQKFIGFLQTTLPPRMPEPEDSVAGIRRMPGAWCVESVERLGIENSQSWRSEDIRMRMDGFDDQYEGASEDDAMDLDDDSEGCDELMSGVITKASICSPSHQMNKFADNQLSFTSDQVVVKRIQDRTAGVKKIVLHKFKTLTDAEVLPLTTWFPNLVSIEFYICEMITDAVVVSLAEHCPRLQYLLLPGCAKVTDNGIKAVARHCPRLRHLDLRACSLVSDESLIEIAENCPDLWHLNCGRVTGAHRVTGKSIVPIAKNTSLNTLGLAGCGMTDDAVIKIAEYCREGLNRISLNCCTELTSAAIRALMIYCPSLAVLEIKKCLKIRDMAPLNHFVRQRILVELCPDLQKRLVAYKVELASQQAAAAVASSSEGNTSTAITPPARQESDDAGHENQQPPGANHLQTANTQPGAAASTSSHTPSTILTTTTTTTTMTNTMITSTTTTTTTTTASTAITTIVTTQ
ncbi:Antagonist of MEN (Mitotic Exit Network) [Actinomortierella wolfii]|nr:Antagonist of MEN (Mitotic Exit Network) [Actinomortierella wolfii]